ncbi:MAG: 4-(cytidine 5'-diphospho)-2-C-methyl-D-erythritol kinase [Propionibacteriaceae bacterium]|jgi:4-diphosphocytidyl-2-C-methyl-D-erythritol kinase|nr:4-(cytidine 5'-diphospho)-2-C-methyl-D-erythritol kinase [Propionibacteriaceae bacterium]
MSPEFPWNDLTPLGPNRVKVRVPAKINLTLNVGQRADDGYHPLLTVFQAVGLYDEITAMPVLGGVISVLVRGAQAHLVPTDGTDLGAQAARLLRSRYGLPSYGASIEIDKQIPVAGGMAGGSADAAGTLVACSELWGLELSPNELQLLAAELGSDVPFSLNGGTVIAHGRGTDMVPLMCRGTYYWALAFAETGLSTPAVFQRFDELNGAAAPKRPADVPHELLAALIAGDAKTLGKMLSNDLEPAALDLCPALADTLAYGRSYPGVLGGLVSGSGPTCAFLVENPRALADLVGELRVLPRVRAAVGVTAPARGAHLISAHSSAA